MNVYLVKNGEQSGPFTWDEIFAKLSRGELTLDDLGREGATGEIRRLEEFAQWGAGDEAGPFTWDEISELLREGVIDTDALARFEDGNSYSPLREVIDRSEEIELTPPAGQAAPVMEEQAPFSPRHMASGPHARLAWAAAAILLIGLGAFWATRPPKPIPAAQVSTPPHAAEAGQAPAPEPAPPATVPLLASAESAAPVNAPSQPMPPQAPVIEPVPLAQAPTLTSANPPPLPPPDVAPKEIPAVNPPASVPLVPEVPQTAATAPKNPPPPPAPVARTTPVPKSSQAQMASVSDFFKIESVKFEKKPPKGGVGVWEVPMVAGKPGTPIYFPSVHVTVSARENTRSDKTFAKAYFYNAEDKLTHSLPKPSKSGRARYANHPMPVLFRKDEPASLFFAVPKELEGTAWKALVVFGDKQEAQTIVYPPTASAFRLDYPEKELVSQKTATRVARKPALDPLIEYVVKTRHPKLPQMTLFFRPPRNVTDSSEIRGVMALCLLANSLDEVRRELQKEEMSGDNHGNLAFADKNKLAILAWGANSSLWAEANYDELSQKQARNAENSFAIVANAWERGVQDLGEKYGMPTKNFLIKGQCGSAHLAKALCLAKPQYFLAIHIHIPGLFEPPTPEASRVLWCITTGELYYSYDYSLRFVADAKKMGYPILYKAFVGLGHAGHPDASAMGQEFFKFALTQKDIIEEHEKKKSSSIDSFALSSDKSEGPWLEAFKNPPMYGDIINQEVFPANQVEMIPEGFRTAIPTKELAEIWKKNR